VVFHRGTQYEDQDGSPLAKLAARQHGAVAWGQLRALGFSGNEITKLVHRGYLIRLYRGVYAVGHDRLTVRGRWMAAVLACGETAVLSHRSATSLWDLANVPSGPIDVTGLTGRRVPGIRCRRARTIHPDDRTIIDGIPVTSLPRTLLDQAQTLHRQRLRTLVEQVQRRGLLNLLALDALLSRSNGRKGAAALRAVLDELHDEAPWTQSELERHFLEFVRTYRLPEPRTNVLIDGILVDCFWPEYNLVAELDGYRFHTGHRSFESDRHKGITHVRAGRRSINITQRMITRGARALRADLEALLD
jgi:predicted transcriptional regulator of viral defense system